MISLAVLFLSSPLQEYWWFYLGQLDMVLDQATPLPPLSRCHILSAYCHMFLVKLLSLANEVDLISFLDASEDSLRGTILPRRAVVPDTDVQSHRTKLHALLICFCLQSPSSYACLLVLLPHPDPVLSSSPLLHCCPLQNNIYRNVQPAYRPDVRFESSKLCPDIIKTYAAMF